MLNLMSQLNNPKTSQRFMIDIISYANYLAGKTMHVCFSLGSKSLALTSQGYLLKTGTQVDIDEKSLSEIEIFKQHGKGIIILNHTDSCNFGDYFPLFSYLGDDILKQTFIYTGSANLEMNQKEFPDYTFRGATSRKNSDIKEILQNVKSDIKTINEKGGYIFIVPSGFETSLDAGFKGIFTRMVSELGDDCKVLANNIDRGFSYTEIILGILSGNLGKVTLKSVSTSISDWKGRTGAEMRQYYNEMFPIQK